MLQRNTLYCKLLTDEQVDREEWTDRMSHSARSRYDKNTVPWEATSIFFMIFACSIFGNYCVRFFSNKCYTHFLI